VHAKQRQLRAWRQLPRSVGFIGLGEQSDLGLAVRMDDRALGHYDAGGD
jgi:hypothetical protein